MTAQSDNAIDPGHLNLQTLIDLPELGFVLDGEWFPYASTVAWSLRERAQFRSLYQQSAELETKEDVTEADSARYEKLRLQLCQAIAPTAPREKLAALADVQRGALITDFLSRSGEPMKQIVPARHLALMQLASAMASSTGAKSSPASNGSTRAARRKRG